MKSKSTITLCILAAATCLMAYLDGRFAFPLGLPSVVFGFLAYIIFLGIYLIRTFAKKHAGRARVVRLAVAGLTFLLISLPALVDDGYLEMGRRDHVRSIFTPAVLTDLTQRVREHAAKPENKQKHFPLDLKKADLPAAVSASAWRVPRVDYRIEGDDGPVTIYVTWGGALTAHHGLVITNEKIPHRGYPVYAGDSGKQEYYYQRYYPLCEGAYIFIDEN